VRTRLVQAFAVIGAVTVLVLAANSVALAANGKGFLLGKSNTATSVTALTNIKKGTVLALHAKPGSAPLWVSNTSLVSNLNSFRLDGKSANDLSSWVYSVSKSVTTPTGSIGVPINVPAGSYVISYSAYLVGAYDTTADCYLTGGNQVVGESRIATGGNTPGLTGTGLLTVTAAEPGELFCTTSGSNELITLSSEPIQVVAQRVDAVKSTPSN
jgi:hypothetical protein